MIRVLILSVSALGLGACMTTEASTSNIGVAVAQLAASDGTARGTARVAQSDGSLRVSVSGAGLPTGAHGIHLHTTGRCDAPDFSTAGPHWNPSARKHGTDNPEGPHHGDLPNIDIGSDGRGTLSYSIPTASLDELLDADGAALVIHANADDNRTDPSGNSGGRIVCGVLRRR